MNMPVEASPDQPAWGDARGDSAEAAQRDLSEFLATCDAPPPLAADAPPQVEFAPPTNFAPSDFVRASDGMPSVSPDRPSAPDQSECALPESHPHSAPAHRDADTEACERAARSAAQAVNDVTKENLRRLEATMSWLHKEAQACHLPRTPQLAPVRGVPIVQACPASLPGFDAVIDRSSLHRTVHGATMRRSPPLPIWLCEHEAPIRLPPPRRVVAAARQVLLGLHGCGADRLRVRHYDVTAPQASRRDRWSRARDIVATRGAACGAGAITWPRPERDHPDCSAGAERDRCGFRRKP
jgi:hypothetical protein